MASLLSILQNNPKIAFKEPDRLYYNQFPVKLVFRGNDSNYYNCFNFITYGSQWVNHAFIMPQFEFNEPYRIRRNDLDFFSFFVTSNESGERIIDHINQYYKVLDSKGIEQYLVAVEFPLTDTREQQLVDGKIFRNKNFKYRYRVAITDGLMKRHTPAVKELLKAIDEDQDNFRCNNGMLHRLRAFSYLYNNYYYCNDLGHITWLKLLDPDFIKKIQSVVQKT